jgi:protein PhnA
MSTEQLLRKRSEEKCELCSTGDALSPFEVLPSDGSLEQSILACEVCQAQLNATTALDADHWRCLNDSMWSPVPAVQVVAWRQLNALTKAGESWAQDQLDMMYLEEDVAAWANNGAADDNEEGEATRDSNGAQLFAGDTVTLIKDLTVKGAGFTAKRGTAVRNISLTNNPEHIEGRVNGVKIVLLSCYLKKQ